MYSRKEFLKQSAFTAGSLLTGFEILRAAHYSFNGNNSRPRQILLRSGWQVENIGDIAHTPAALALLEQYMKDTTVVFWPFYKYLPDYEVAMIKKRFPKLRIVQGTLDAAGNASSAELEDAIRSSDFLLHNSGPATLAWADAAAFKKKTGKPFGVYGVSYGLYGTPERDTLNDAEFVYFRDSASLQKAREAGVRARIMEFSPDVVFAVDMENEEAAASFLQAHALEKGRFVCCIPKHRNTPAWLHKHKNRPLDETKQARNEAMKEHDHVPLREAITAIVRSTDLKVLICHEDETELPIGKEWLLDKLPEDVKPRVVWRNTPWLPDEAISIYKRSAGFFGSEMHSPIMCIAQGIPAIVVRWEEQSTKGIMWQDIGLGEWLFNFDNEADIERFVPSVLEMVNRPSEAMAKAMKARKRVHLRLKETMKEVEKASRPA